MKNLVALVGFIALVGCTTSSPAEEMFQPNTSTDPESPVVDVAPNERTFDTVCEPAIIWIGVYCQDQARCGLIEQTGVEECVDFLVTYIFGLRGCANAPKGTDEQITTCILETSMRECDVVQHDELPVSCTGIW